MMSRREVYLGVDGGQSHTEAVIGDGAGNIMGRGQGGPSNHVEQPGGRERLERAIVESVGEALAAAGEPPINATKFKAAHCAMTGSADFKFTLISGVLHAEQLRVGHDAPAALAGATAGEPGIAVIAGTGSVAYGENPHGETLRVGGWGYLFGDEGSGFWIAKEGLRRAMLAHDGLQEETRLTETVLQYFKSSNLEAIEVAVACGRITRDHFASFAKEVHHAAVDGDRAAREIVAEAGRALAALAAVIATRLRFTAEATAVAYVGGMFRAELVRAAFQKQISEQVPGAIVQPPRFGPAVGALLLAYRLGTGEARVPPSLLVNLAGKPGSQI